MPARHSLIRRLSHTLGSVQLAMVLLIGGGIAMSTGTFLESREGVEAARALVYGTRWFDAYLFMIAVNLVMAVVNRIPIKAHQWSFVLTHAAIVLLLFGAWITRSFGVEGRLAVTQGGRVASLELEGEQLLLSAGEETLSLMLPPRGQGSLLRYEGLGMPSVRILATQEEAILVDELVYAPVGSLGVEFTLADAVGSTQSFVLEGHADFARRTIGAVEVELLRVESEEALTPLLTTLRPDPIVVVVPHGGGPEVEIPFAGESEGIECGNGVSAVLSAVYRNARVGVDGLSESPSEGLNPAAVVRLRRGDQVETHTIFARFPDFGTATNVVGDGLVAAVRLSTPGAESGPAIRLIVGPNGQVNVQASSAAGREPARAVALAKTVKLEPLGLYLTIDRVVPSAEVRVAARPVHTGNEGRFCARVQLARKGEVQTLWIPMWGEREVTFAGAPVRVSLRRPELQLPFELELTDFHIWFHPGSDRPSAYESQVLLTNLERRTSKLATVISMNRPLDFMGYRLFQGGYVLGENGQPTTILLSVARDPGSVVVTVAFVLLILGIGWYLLGDGRRRHSRGMTASEQLQQRASGTGPEDCSTDVCYPKVSVWTPLLLPIVACLLASSGLAQTEGRSDLAMPFEHTAGWAVQSGGRVKPLDTYATETTVAITGRQNLDGLDALQIFWGFQLARADFASREYVRVESEDLKAAIGLPPDQLRFSFEQLLANTVLQDLVQESFRLERAGERLPPLEQAAHDTYAKLERIRELMEGHSLRVVPRPDGAAWSDPGALQGSPDMAEEDVFAGFVQLAAAHRAGDVSAFVASADALSVALRELSPENYPASVELERELAYNRMGAFGRAWKLYLAGFLVLALVAARRRRLAWSLGCGAMLVGIGFHSVGLVVRWQIAGRVPVSDMYESLVFMSWGIVVLGLVLEAIYRKGYFGTAAGLTGFLTLAFAEHLPIDSSINPLVPVLANTAWLSIHVMTIMLSYSAFALAMGMGHIVLGMQLFRPGKAEQLRSLSNLLYKTLQVGVLFLAAGIGFGAIWANESWGRYWGWDPKETWSLITFFVYLVLVHARFAGWMHHFGLAAGSVLAFLAVVMTYYGVNFILGAGLHSYGFASGGALYVTLYVAAELILITAALVRYRHGRRLARGSSPQPCSDFGAFAGGGSANSG